jgi:hypothetical protein
MKKLTVASLLLVAGLTQAHESHDKDIKFVGDHAYKNFCKAVTKDNVRLLKSSFASKIGIVAGSQRETYRKLLASENLSCNGMGIVEFSKTRKAEDVLAYLEAKQQNL